MNTERSYFTDYEVWSEGLPVSWGNMIVVLPDPAMAPADVLALVRRNAACERLASPHEIRVRTLVRL